MKISSITICIMMIVTASMLMAAPKTVTLTASKDCVVRADQPNTSFSNDPNLTAYKNTINDQAYFYCQFDLPFDCLAENIDASTFTFKFVLNNLKMTVTRAGYLFGILQAAETEAGDLNSYTFNTAPGINPSADPVYGTAPYISTEARVVGYGTPSSVEGGVWSYTPPAGSYQTYLKDYVLAQDDDGKLTFFFLPRFVSTDGIGDDWASIENTEYEGPQIEFTYEPIELAKEVIVDYSGQPAQEQDTVATTYTVALSDSPDADVTVSFEYDTDVISVSPASLTFTASDYDVPQIVTVTPIDDGIAKEMVYTATIDNIPTSSDEGYQFAPIESVDIFIQDNDYKVVVLDAIADNDVMSIAPDTAFASETELAPKKADSPVDYVYTYMQFEMPADFEYALGGTKFKLTRTYVSPTSSYLYLMGVRDTNRDTGEIIPEGDVDSYTWNTAPGLDIVPDPLNTNTLSGYDPDISTFIANAAGAPTATPGTEMYMLTSTVNEPMRTFINSNIGDDGKITLFIVARILQSDVDRFASIENELYNGPQIELVYGSTPYCGQPGQGMSVADIDEDCDVDIDDMEVMAAQWLNIVAD